MCKHVAAVLYGVGARLDNKPELLFALRGVDHEELIAADAEKAVAAATSRGKSKRLAASELGEVFGIELAGEAAINPAGPSTDSPTAVSTKKKPPRARKPVTPSTTTAAKPRGGRKAAKGRKDDSRTSVVGQVASLPVQPKIGTRRQVGNLPHGNDPSADPKGRRKAAATKKTDTVVSVSGKASVSRRGVKKAKPAKVRSRTKSPTRKQPLSQADTAGQEVQ